MKSWLLLAALSVVLSAAGTVAVSYYTAGESGPGPGFPAATPSETAKAPSVSVDGDLVYQFGVMAQKTEGTHQWIFRNEGPGVLELRNGGTDCSCTMIQLPKSAPDAETTSVMVSPGASRPIDVTWKTNEFDGAYKKTARIGTNDPRRPEITLEVVGTVRPPLTIVPSESAINFMTINSEESTRRQVALFSGSQPAMQLSRVESSNPAFIVATTRPLTEAEAKDLSAARGFMLEVAAQPTSKLGAFAEEVVVHTDVADRPEVRFKVMGQVVGPITLTPEKVFLRDVIAGKGGSRQATISVRGQQAVEFTVVRKPAGVEVAVEPIRQAAEAKGAKYRLVVRVLPDTPAGSIRDEVVLRTSHPSAAEIKVPIDALIQRSE